MKGSEKDVFPLVAPFLPGMYYNNELNSMR
jgi:hypothetical protein